MVGVVMSLTYASRVFCACGGTRFPSHFSDTQNRRQNKLLRRAVETYFAGRVWRVLMPTRPNRQEPVPNPFGTLLVSVWKRSTPACLRKKRNAYGNDPLCPPG